jgi:hypothetical protein
MSVDTKISPSIARNIFIFVSYGKYGILGYFTLIAFLLYVSDDHVFHIFPLSLSFGSSTAPTACPGRII